MSRRGAGEGSIYLEKSSGLWAASISVGGRGERRRKTIRRKKRSDLVQALAKMQADPVSATAPRVKVTLTTSGETWLNDVVAVNNKPKTAAGYRQIFEGHVEPRLGKMELAQIEPRHVQHFMAELARAEVGARTRQLALFVLRSILANAKALGQVKSNAAEDTEMPSHRAKAPAYHDAASATRVITKARKLEPDYAAFYALAYDSGARWGELAGVQWPDLDLKAGKWTVLHNLVDVEGEVTLTESPKTPAGRRTILLSAECTAALRAHRARMTKAGRDVVAGYVFTSPDGAELRLSNFTQRVHDPLLAAAKVKRVSPHGLRHTLATLLLAAGVPIKVVAERLGHEDVTTTLRIYQHVLPSQQVEAAVRIGRILRTGRV